MCYQILIQNILCPIYRRSNKYRRSFVTPHIFYLNESQELILFAECWTSVSNIHPFKLWAKTKEHIGKTYRGETVLAPTSWIPSQRLFNSRPETEAAGRHHG